MGDGHGKRTPPDQAQRDLIVESLDRNLLVEAAAGTGKTTSMVNRMIALLREGKCREIGCLAAVTFTRKAAAELRTRFQRGLEEAVENSREGDPAGDRLRRAMARVEQCVIGTIHSFCARLLRERPVEAGVDPAFVEGDEKEDRRLQEEAFDAYVARCYARQDPILDLLDRAGLEIGRLKDAFLIFADYPDVDEWPAAPLPVPDLDDAARALDRYVAHINRLDPTLPRDPGTDKLMPRYRLLARMWRHADGDDFGAFVEIMETVNQPKVVQKCWPGGKEQALKEEARWAAFREEWATPALRACYAYRYGLVMPVLAAAREVYDRLRRERGMLNYQDLLMKSVALLRENPGVRAYFQHRFTHLLIDEFQDTDPVQAEVMLLLTADDRAERNWQKCRPRAGALFVVGDPKQSIYRFRRADIVTYNQVKRILRDNDGEVVHLSCSFRTRPEGVAWVNRVFEGTFPEKETDASPAYVPLKSGVEADPGPGEGIFKITMPGRTNDEIIEGEADLVARAIRRDVDSGVSPGDFLIVTKKTKHLSRFALKLQAYGLPHQVSGGTALNRVAELRLLRQALKTVIEEDNPVALVALLRGGLFGFSDRALFAFKEAGGCFDFRAPLPEALEEDLKRRFAEAFAQLKDCRSRLDRYPLLPALEKITRALGLPMRARAASGGDLQAGSLAKAVEVLRSAQEDHWTAGDLLDFLNQIIDEEEKHDGLPATPMGGPAVRVMNLHKAKGLEAPVVFLADPTGESRHAVEICVDRSQERVRGYLQVRGEGKDWNPPVLARPENWEELERRESAFLEAEGKRLLYVAATRAGRRLVVTLREKAKSKNPWAPFESHLDDCPALDDPGVVPLPDPMGERLDPKWAKARIEEVKTRWLKIREKTYERKAARAKFKRPGEREHSDGEDGVRWGTVIHALLEAALSGPGVDLRGLARSELLEMGLDQGHAGEAFRIVDKVMKSDIWQRAVAAERRCLEVPVQGTLDDGSLVRGVIDLVFREGRGWVIVDYKTDRLRGAAPEKRAKNYRGQLENYARLWEKATGEKVIGQGIFFTEGGIFCPVE